LVEQMTRQLESRECQRCGVESIDLDDFLWYDADAQEWRTGPICIDRKACRDRRDAAEARTIADELAFRRIVSS
jgi:hypothetical protein